MFECNTGKSIGCTAGKVDFCVCKGDSFIEEIKWVKESTNDKTIPVNLRGFSAIMTVISAHSTKNETVLELVNPTGISLDNNKIIINLPHQVIENFTWKKGDYSLTMISPQGVRQTILKGRFTVIGSSGCCK